MIYKREHFKPSSIFCSWRGVVKTQFHTSPWSLWNSTLKHIRGQSLFWARSVSKVVTKIADVTDEKREFLSKTHSTVLNETVRHFSWQVFHFQSSNGERRQKSWLLTGTQHSHMRHYCTHLFWTVEIIFWVLVFYVRTQTQSIQAVSLKDETDRLKILEMKKEKGRDFVQTKI